MVKSIYDYFDSEEATSFYEKCKDISARDEIKIEASVLAQLINTVSRLEGTVKHLVNKGQ